MLAEERCSIPLRDQAPLSEIEIAQLIEQIPGWQLDEGRFRIEREFRFENFHETMAFVNAMAWIAHQQDHHPDLEIGYKHCLVRYSTHSIGGLSDNDFICAAKIEQLLS